MKVKKLVYISVFLLITVVGCSHSLDKEETLAEEKVYIYIVESDQSLVKDFEITPSEIGNSADIGIILDPTDADGKIETTLKVGSIYGAYLAIDDQTIQDEEFTISNRADDNQFIFQLKEE